MIANLPLSRGIFRPSRTFQPPKGILTLFTATDKAGGGDNRYPIGRIGHNHVWYDPSKKLIPYRHVSTIATEDTMRPYRPELSDFHPILLPQLLRPIDLR